MSISIDFVVGIVKDGAHASCILQRITALLVRRQAITYRLTKDSVGVNVGHMN